MVDQLLERFERLRRLPSNKPRSDFYRNGSRSAMVDQLLERFERLRKLTSNKPRSSPVSIGGLLLASLEDPHMMICIAVSVSVSTIAQYDWPELLPFLLSLLNDQTKLNAVHGSYFI
ncbi:hypothetical protein ACS0TY_001996 [Phlomoides rotata]